MRPRFTLPLLGGLSAVAGLALGALLPQKAVADDGKVICADSGAAGYVHRQLASDDSDNFCETYRGKVVLVVNTASRCAFTDQYDGLEELYATYREQGLVVVGFPSNDFANQEPGSESSIKKFCRLTYGVQFPMYAKTHVRGEQADPLYKALAEAAGESPRWNFHKYLIDREGRLAGSFSSFTKPHSKKLRQAIEGLL
jgi:glutathione peroxidase